ncbi:EF-P lysine aminoacylase EpmA [Salinispira pacifica]
MIRGKDAMELGMMQARARILTNIRDFFRGRGYMEVDTPALAPGLIPESTIEAFRTELVSPFLSKQNLYLVPSPEIWMKRLIAEGAGDIFQLSHVFRNSESVGRQHSPEFTMLEWYTMGADYQESIETTEDMVRSLVQLEIAELQPSEEERLSRLLPPFVRLSMADAFRVHAGVDLARCGDARDLAEEARKLGLTPRDDDSWQELFNRIFLTFVEPNIARERPTVLTDYPSQVATLARAVPDTPWSERWELYLDGRETANCYTEETDPNVVRRFFEAETAEKQSALVGIDVDDGFPDIFASGFPACSGVALGVDRLIMALTGASDIRGVIFFPVHDRFAP